MNDNKYTFEVVQKQIIYVIHLCNSTDILIIHFVKDDIMFYSTSLNLDEKNISSLTS